MSDEERKEDTRTSVVHARMIAGRYRANNANVLSPQTESSYKKARATLENSRVWSQLNPSTEVVSSDEWILGLSSPVMASYSMVVG